MPELLFEIGTEEIPADDLQRLFREFQSLATTAFDKHRLAYSTVVAHGTPRRLTLVAELEARQKDLREEKLGPPKKVAFDADGKPTPAAIGFAKNSGLDFKELKVVQTPKGEYLTAEVVIEGRPAAEILREILPEVVSKLPFKKFMKWGAEEFVFGRPIRNLLFLFDGEVIPMALAGVQSGRSTFGHRFLGNARVDVSSFADYQAKLLENGVVLTYEDRVERILAGLDQQTKAVRGTLRQDSELLATMANEVEYPEVLSGSFPPEFLVLPQEILINAMRKHQKYFCAVDEKGQLLPHFFTVLNTRAARPDLIRKGHERVLLARLRDAEFFWNEDRKATLESRNSLLDRLTYHEKLGSYTGKVERMHVIANLVLDQLHLRRHKETIEKLIRLSKVDLMTHMVGEFPELQGIMGGLYAKKEGFPDAQWQALYDQYLPVSAEDRVPRNQYGALLSLIDRLEILSSGYALNMIPTGSRDPYALRRIATGAMKIILEFKFDLDLRPILQHTLSLYTLKSRLSKDEMLNGILELLEARFRFLMEQKGIAFDFLNAVLSVEKNSFLKAYVKTNSLWSKHDSDDLKTLSRCFKRIQNITSSQPALPFDQEKLQEDGERRLYQVFSDIEFRIQQLIQEGQYLDALEIMVTLGPEIDNFFDEVLVMAEEESLKNNRIALLQTISNLYRKIADFSQLQIEL